MGEAGKKCTFTFQGMVCNLEFKSDTEATVKNAKDGKEYACRPKKLAALDSHEENRRVSQKRASAAVAAEQERLIAEHGTSLRRSHSVPDPEILSGMVKD